jgi:hypothetical protein
LKIDKVQLGFPFGLMSFGEMEFGQPSSLEAAQL